MSGAEQAIALARVPVGVPVPEDFALITLAPRALEAGEVRVQAQYLSLDPYLRGVLSGRHMGHRCELGAVVPGAAVGRVVESRDPALQIGDTVIGEAGWRALPIMQKPRRWDIDAPVSTSLGVLGMPGLTAWAGVAQIAKPQPQETLVVSAAAGPVGASVGQLAQVRGARAVGIAGGAEKCALVKQQYGFADCIDYKRDDFAVALKHACPNGIDVYFDNVGGAVLEVCISMLALHARVVLCGLMDQYNQETRPKGPNLGPVIGARAMLKGLVVYDYYPQFDSFLSEMAPLVKSQQVRFVEDISVGIGQTPAAFCRLMRGENRGKTLVKLLDDYA
jgi:NADPH-dependent curcumin reductase CurA